MNGTNHYDVLNVSRTATYGVIKDSFHRLARAKHPDKYRGNKDNEIGDDKVAAEFRLVQEAWHVLRDSDQRIAYDSDLLQKDSQEINKRNGAIELSYHDDLEEAIDEETNERFMVYDCRCGEEIHVDYNSMTNDLHRKSASSNKRKNIEFLVDCSGCCFVYRIIGK